MKEIIGIILMVQGIGGFINRVAESTSKSWFVQLHVLPDSMHIVVSVLMAVLGAGLIIADIAASRKRKRAES